MVHDEPGERVGYVFVIDTDAYAGNFERELAAYCTGQVGESNVGIREAGVFLSEEGEAAFALFEAAVERRGDDKGRRTPASIWPTPGRRLGDHGAIVEGAPQPGETAHPAYLSVAIFFRTRPTEAMVALMRRRATELAGRPPRPSLGGRIAIAGFRLVTVRTSVCHHVETI